MTVTITDSASAVAATPFLLGFQPTDSLVLIFSDPGRIRVSLRVDLPDQPELEWVCGILGSIPDPAPESVILLLYADTVGQVFAQRIADWMMEVLSPVMEILDVVIVCDGTVRSLVRSMRDGCEGLPLSDLENHPVVAACIAEGMSKLGSRRELEARLDHVDDNLACEVLRLIQAPRPPAPAYEQWRETLEREGLRVLLDSEAMSARDVMYVGLACSDVFARDPIIALLLEEHERDEEMLFRVRDRLAFAVSRLPDDAAGPTAATLALLSWVAGGGAQAMIAAQKAMDTDPTNTLGPLVADALQHGLPPHTWGSITQDIPIEVLRGQYKRSA